MIDKIQEGEFREAVIVAKVNELVEAVNASLKVLGITRDESLYVSEASDVGGGDSREQAGS